jgi:hypothetical protein
MWIHKKMFKLVSMYISKLLRASGDSIYAVAFNE